MILTKDLCDKIIEHLNERRSDMNPKEIDEAIKILNFNVGKELNSINHTLVDRLMDDDELQNEFYKCKVSDTEINAFD